MNQKEELQRLLKHCSLHVHLILLSQVLARSGYGDVQILNRRHNRQRSSLGGCELLCQSTIGPSPVKVIVKVINDSVRTRMLDELSGAIDRTASDFGILVTPHDLNETKRKLQAAYKRSHIEVIDGSLLADMLFQFRIAVRPNGKPDYLHLQYLEEEAEALLASYLDRVRAR